MNHDNRSYLAKCLFNFFRRCDIHSYKFDLFGNLVDKTRRVQVYNRDGAFGVFLNQSSGDGGSDKAAAPRD
jgi:hypothetical protein